MDMAVLLLRKSDENAEADDFDIQEDICRAYATSKGYGVYAVYREAHSGKHNPLGRTVLRQAIGDIKSGRAQVMVIRSYDRLARTIEQTYSILFEVETLYHGRVEAASASEQFDRSSPAAKMLFTVMQTASEMERDRIFDRFQTGKKKRAARGYLSGAPQPRFGYAWADDVPGKRTTYVIDENVAPIVRRIFTLAAEGASIRSIALTLNREGVPTPSTYAASLRNTGKRHVGKVWRPEQVRVLLTDQRYAGKPLAYRYETRREYRDGKERMVRSFAEHPVHLPIESWPAIVTPELFALAQMRQQAQLPGRKSKVAALMRGHVLCGICGRRMEVSVTNKRTYGYTCSMRRSKAGTPEETCRSHSMSIHLVDEMGWNAVKYLLASREKFVELLHARFAQPDNGAVLASAAGALQEKQEELATLAGSIGLTSNETVRQSIIAQMEAVSEQVQKLEAAYQELQQIADTEKAGEAWIQTTLDRIYSWHNAWVQDVNAGTTDDLPTDEQIAQFEALPFEIKRAAVEASGVTVRLYPVGWREAHEEMPDWLRDRDEETKAAWRASLASRTVVSIEQPMDDFTARRLFGVDESGQNAIHLQTDNKLPSL